MKMQQASLFEMESPSLISRVSLFYINHENNYQEDYKTIIREREVDQITFLHQSPQIFYRSSIIKYLKNYANKNKISYSCLHLTVYIMDIFMDNHIILPERLHLVANVCLLLAAKLEEVSANIPKISDLNAAVNNRYSTKEYKNVEIIILKFFNWYVMYPTAAHYAHYFVQAALSPQEIYNDHRTYHTLIFELYEHINNYLDQIIEDIHFMQIYTPSQLAAAIIAAARKQAGLSSWTEQLEKFTEYSKQQIWKPVKALMKSNCLTCSNCKKEV